MPFDYAAPLDDVALKAAAGFYGQLPELKAGMYFDHQVLHWSGGAYGCTEGAYNAEIVLENKLWVPKITHNPLDNAIEITDGPYAAHTLGRNSHGFGFSVAAMRDATTSDFGDQKLQYHQLDMLLSCAGTVGLRYNLQVGEMKSLYTHAECAVWDGYPDARWDLGRVDPSKNPLTPQERSATGNALRARCHAYKAQLAQILKVSV